jgi:hypothetical protein
MLSASSRQSSNERCSCGGLQTLAQSCSTTESRLTEMEVVVLSITNSNQEHNSMNDGYPKYQHLVPGLNIIEITYVLQKGSSRSNELGIYRGVL